MPEVFKVTKTTFKDEQELIKFLKGIQNNITSFEVSRASIKLKLNNDEIILGALSQQAATLEVDKNFVYALNSNSYILDCC